MRVWPLLALSIALVPLTAAAQHAGHQHTPGAPSEGHLRAQRVSTSSTPWSLTGVASAWRSPPTSRAIRARCTCSS
jgi:hypothetical protein